MKTHRTVNGKSYKMGYTTGTCAAGAAKAAVMMLQSGEYIKWVDIALPNGEIVALEVTDVKFEPYKVTCAIVKDGGDDPDVTHGLSVYCEAIFNQSSEILIKAGEGIGKVTFPGLKVAIGEAAINPVPREMIIKAIGQVLSKDVGVTLTFSIPGGEQVALQTYNPKLGIVGGLSILGTTGVVVPMSEEAWRDAIEQEIAVLAARGHKIGCLVFGNYGEDYAKEHLHIGVDKIVKISNFVGYFLEKSVEYGIEKVLFIGHIGKLIKVSAGIFNTHSKVADARMEVLVSHLALAGAPTKIIKEVFGSKTTDGALAIIERTGYKSIFKNIANLCSERCLQYTYGKLEVATVLFGGRDKALAFSDNTESILLKIKEPIKD